MRHRTAVLGAVIFACFFISSYTVAAVSFILFFLTGISGIFARLRLRRKTVSLVLAGAAASFLIYGIYTSVYISPAEKLYGQTCDMTATVTSVSSPDNDTQYVTASGTANGVPVKFSFYSPDIGAEPGDIINLTVKFSAPAVTASYNGDYNYSRGVFVRAAAKSVSISGKRVGISLTSLLMDYSEYLRERVREELTGEEGGLMLAMCFGDKSRLSAELSDAVARSGLSHMTAVSGMHISLIITSLMSLFDTFGLGKRTRLKFFTAAGLSAIFIVFFGMSASVIRSGIMMTIYSGSLLFRRKSAPADSLSAAVMLILLTEPCACRDTGLMLSVCGTVGAGTVAPAVGNVLRRHFPLPKKADLLLVGIFASYCTLPVSALVFGRVSLVSALSSAAVYPMFLGVMIILLIVAFTGGLAAHAFLLPAGILLKAMTAVIRFFAGARYSCITPDSGIIVPFTVASAVFITTAVLAARTARRRRYAAFLASAVCVLTFAGLVTLRKWSDADITKVTIYSDGSNFLAAVDNSTGVSVYSSGINSRLSRAAYDAMTAHGSRRLDLLCVLEKKKRAAVYSDTFDSIDALQKLYLDGTEHTCDVGGRYTAEVYTDAVCLEINGVSIILTDVTLAPYYGSHDIAVYSGYGKGAEYDMNGAVILCDKRYIDVQDAINAYYTEVEIRIDADGKCLIKTK